MEGVPRISMMCFPLRKSADAASFKIKLKTYIRDEYKEDPEAYNQEIHDIEALRAAAIHISKDFSGCSTLKKYFCQLNYLKTRFHMTEGAACAISFSWRDAFSETVHGWSDIEFEMSSILYNIGALHSELGASDNRQTADGMKNACTHFQCAAWAFQHMRNNYQSFFTQDISPDCLSIMTNICLAQAQECILEKSLIDNRKSTITAKVALQIVEYYQLALKTCDQMVKDASQYSDKVIKAVKNWKKLIELKSHYYACISFLYRGMQAEDENKYGERVTFYKAALEKLNEALKYAKSLEKTDNVHDTLQFTFDVVQGKVAISEKENEFVYHEKVPELSAINGEIKAVSLVKGIPFKFDDPQIAGPDIFLKLVPIEAHEVSSLYSEEKAKVLRHFATKIEKKNEALDKIVAALQLDQLDFDTSVKKIPQELVDCCAALSVNKDAVKKLSVSMGKLSGMFRDVEDNLEEIEQLIKMEEKKEQDYEKIMGTKRKPNNVITELSKEVQKYRSAHTVAAETNQTLHDALSKHVGNLQILMKPFEEVVNYIPSIEEDEADREAIAQMKKLIAKIDEMKTQRITLEEQLRESIHNDDITEKIVVKVDSDLTDLFCQEIMKHEKHTKILDQNLLAQENIIRALTEANAAYAETRKKTVALMKRRDKVIEDLITSYESYDELLAKCNKGIEFYTKLDSNVQNLLQRLTSVCKVQEEERETSMKALINNTNAMSLNPQIPGMSNIGYVPPSLNSSIPNEFSMPSSGGHLKLKDVMAMKKLQPQQQNPTPVFDPSQNPTYPASSAAAVPNEFSIPSSGGHLKLRDVLAMKKLQPQQQNPTPVFEPSQNPNYPASSVASVPFPGNYFQSHPQASSVPHPQNFPPPQQPQAQNYHPPQQPQTQNFVQPQSQNSQNYPPSSQPRMQNYPSSSQSHQGQTYPPVSQTQNQSYTPNSQPQSQSHPFPPTSQPQNQNFAPVPQNQQQSYAPTSQPQSQNYAPHSQPQTQNYQPHSQNFTPASQPQSQNQSFSPQRANQNYSPSSQPQNQDFYGPLQSQNGSFVPASQPQNFPPVSNPQGHFSSVQQPQSRPQNFPPQQPTPQNQNFSSIPQPQLQNFPPPPQSQNFFTQPSNQMYQPQQQNIPQQPPPTEYNPNESFLAKYVKQHMGANAPVSHTLNQNYNTLSSQPQNQNQSFPPASQPQTQNFAQPPPHQSYAPTSQSQTQNYQPQPQSQNQNFPSSSQDQIQDFFGPLQSQNGSFVPASQPQNFPQSSNPQGINFSSVPQPQSQNFSALSQPSNQMYQSPQQNMPQQPPPTEYNPNESFLAKYVKQHMGANM